MWFESLKEGITWFFSLPLPIAGISVGTAGAFLVILFSKTSLGKKLYNKAMAKIEEAISKLNTYKAHADKEIEELKEYYEEKLQLVNEKNKQLETLLIAISENINNKKVKELVDTYCEKSNEVIAIADIVDDAVIEAKEQCYKEAEKVISEFEEKLEEKFKEKEKELEEQIEKYKTLCEVKSNEIGKETKE